MLPICVHGNHILIPYVITGIGKRSTKDGSLLHGPSRGGLLALNSVSNLHKWIPTIYVSLSIALGGSERMTEWQFNS